MLSKYDLLIDNKKEVEEYANLLNSFKKLPCENKIRCIAKYILFYKKISEYGENRHYKNSAIYDLLMLMHSLTQQSLRNFYQLYRSFIENYIRSMLLLNDNDETGVRNLFNILGEKFNNASEIEEIINYINGEYSKACDYVHSNVHAEANIYIYYTDIIRNDEMNDENLKKLIEKILVLLKKTIFFTIYEFPGVVNTAFYRRKQELKFLCGTQNYSVFEYKLEEYLVK